MENTLAQGKFKLLDAFLNNEEIPIREFYITEYPKTKYYILKNGGTIANAEDVFQEAYFACWKKLTTGKFCPKNRMEIEEYLFTIAKNKWINQTRALAKRKTTSIDEKLYKLEADETTLNYETSENEQQLSITLKAFESLGQACKDLLTQYYFYKMSLRSISESLNIEEASAKNKKYRCIQKLKELALKK